MKLEDRTRESDQSREHMAFELVVLEDAQRSADTYWSNWLWCREQPAFGPSDELMQKFGSRWGAQSVRDEWHRWFEVLTSWEYVDAIMGRDVRRLLADYDHCTS